MVRHVWVSNGSRIPTHQIQERRRLHFETASFARAKSKSEYGAIICYGGQWTSIG